MHCINGYDAMIHVLGGPSAYRKKTWHHPHGIDEGTIWNQKSDKIKWPDLWNYFELASSVRNHPMISFLQWFADLQYLYLPQRCFSFFDYLRMSKHLGQHGGYKLTVYISLLHFKPFHFFRTSSCGLNVGPTTRFCPRCIYWFFRPFLRPMSSSLCSLI